MIPSLIAGVSSISRSAGAAGPPGEPVGRERLTARRECDRRGGRRDGDQGATRPRKPSAASWRRREQGHRATVANRLCCCRSRFTRTRAPRRKGERARARAAPARAGVRQYARHRERRRRVDDADGPRGDARPDRGAAAERRAARPGGAAGCARRCGRRCGRSRWRTAAFPAPRGRSGVAGAGGPRRPVCHSLAPDGRARLDPAARGVDGALGRILAVVHQAMADGSWPRLKGCPRDVCTGSSTIVRATAPASGARCPSVGTGRTRLPTGAASCPRAERRSGPAWPCAAATLRPASRSLRSPTASPFVSATGDGGVHLRRRRCTPAARESEDLDRLPGPGAAGSRIRGHRRGSKRPRDDD